MQEGFNAARINKGNADAARQFAIIQAEQMLKAAGVIDPELERPEFVKISPEISLQAEWNKQVEKLAGLFAEELGFKTPKEYIETLPKFELQPKQFKDRFDIPVIVETRVPLKKMLELAGITAYFDVNSIKDWKQKQSKTPNIPYTVWLNDGSSNLNKSVDTVRKSLKSDEREANTREVVSLFLKDPKILGKHYLDIPGSKVGPVYSPVLDLWGGGPWLRRGWTGSAYPEFGSVVAGKL